MCTNPVISAIITGFIILHLCVGIWKYLVNGLPFTRIIPVPDFTLANATAFFRLPRPQPSSLLFGFENFFISKL